MIARHATALRGAIGLFALAAVAICAAATVTFEYRWIDLDVYRWGGSTLGEASNLYAQRHPKLGMPFTYTPFAALLFAPLAAAGMLTPFAWTALSGAALGRASWLMARHRGVWLAHIPTGWAALAIAAAVLAAQPGSSTVRLGQVGFVLLWLVCEDLLGGTRRWSGVLVGVAAAVKLTPGVYILLQMITGRARAAGASIVVVCASIGLGWLIAPPESASYWRHLGPDVTTVGPVTAPDHWSINGTLWRIAGTGGSDTWWLLLATMAMLGSLWLARAWWLGGSPLGAMGLVGLGSVLASPFSWSHHWLLVAPLFVALLGAPVTGRAGHAVRVAVALAYALVVTSVWWHLPRVALDAVLDERLVTELAMNSYVLVALILVTLACALRPAPLNARRLR